PRTVTIRSAEYDRVGRWPPLQVRNPVKLLREQQQFLRVKLNRDINLADAYVDQLILNLYGGPGLAEVWIDDLEVGPVQESAAPFATTSRPAGRDVPAMTAIHGRAS